MAIRYPALEESVPVLLNQHFRVELVDAVVDDEDGFGELLEVCGTVAGGDAAGISLAFGDLAAQFERDGVAVDEILDALSPAAVFAGKVKAYNDSIRIR